MLSFAQIHLVVRWNFQSAAFRDILAICVVSSFYARNIYYNHDNNRVLYSGYFRAHPWMIDNEFEHIIASTPAILGIHKAQKFQGQSSSHLFPQRLSKVDFDEALL